MIEVLHYLKDPKLWELWFIPYYMGNAEFISSTVARRLSLKNNGVHGLPLHVVRVRGLGVGASDRSLDTDLVSTS